MEIVSTKDIPIVIRFHNTDTGKIIKMLGWRLIAGANLTTPTELKKFSDGTYRVVVLDQKGKFLFSKDIEKSTSTSPSV